MNKYAGKVRIGVIAIFCGLAFAIVGLHRSSGRAYSGVPTPTLLVSDVCSYAVTAYSAASNGDVSPLAPVPTGLSAPQFVTIDASGNIYATNACTNTITIYAAGSKGDAGPIAIIGGPNTGLSDPAGIALDSNLNIYVANAGAPGVSVYPPLGSSTGLLNEDPIATISGSNTGLSYPQGIAVDSASGNIYVADEGATSVYVYSPLASSTGLPNEAPIATISGLDTGLSSPEGIALDSSLNIYVADESASSVYVYPPLASSTGLPNEAPTATISGSDTGLISPYGIALDSTTGKIYVADALATSVFVYPALGNSVGLPNEVPLVTISGSKTGLGWPQGIALDSSDDIYVADTSSVLVYSVESKGNTAPSSATISTTMTTGLGWPQGIALDSTGKIYVADDGPGASGLGSVFVYPAGSKANAAPTATISGTNTGLSYPQGIAVDSNSNIYVADEGAVSVFVYSAGSKGNVAPTTTISGSNTELDTPEGIVVDSSLNIYVADDGDGSCDGTESVYVYPVGSNGNAGPSATISGGNTGLCYPYGIALDSSGNIYVADEGAASVFVYPPLASLPSQPNYPNVTPIATISGNQTGLSGPYGIALDSSGNIYVSDYSANGVFTYPALGSSTGLLNEPPTATISGPLTELGQPQFIAVQAAVAPTPTATATTTPTMTPTPTAVPTTSISVPKKLEVGKSTLGNTLSKNLDVKNTGKADLFIDSASVSGANAGDFAPGASTCSAGGLAPKGKCTIAIGFTPSALGARSATLTLTDNAGTGTQNVELSGKGEPDVTVSPDRVAYGKVKFTKKKNKTVKVENAQPVAVTLSQIITGTNASDFTVTGGTCSGTLAAKAKCTYIVTFTPGATGARSATLSVTASPDLQSPHNVSLAGTGS
ncbi:MAG: choice-of-anchor D domain-containing protein [Candidatus Binatus sp.]|uniref:choice-of-anchor D domain-containing protein n=1 Tax=Candidatus Binatus sp. TaxID=2811406 RepID=UPI003C763AD8